MRAAVFHGPGDVRLTDVPTPKLREGDVLVRVTAAGICGSDVNRYRYGSQPWPPPFIMGHEFCGEIADVGAGVSEWKVGEQVVVQPTLSCGAGSRARERTAGSPSTCACRRISRTRALRS